MGWESLIDVNALWIQRVKDEGRGGSDEKKRRDRRFVTSSETHGIGKYLECCHWKCCLLFNNRSQVISKSIV